MAQQLRKVEEKLNESNSGDSKTFADVVGGMKEGLIVPMKQAMKEIEMEDEKTKNIVIHGSLEITSSQPKERLRDTILEAASDVIIQTGNSEENVETYIVLGKIDESGRAPPVLVRMKSRSYARNTLKRASCLRKVRGFSRVYITPDLGKDERLKRRGLQDTLKEKIE